MARVRAKQGQEDIENNNTQLQTTSYTINIAKESSYRFQLLMLCQLHGPFIILHDLYGPNRTSPNPSVRSRMILARC